MEEELNKLHQEKIKNEAKAKDEFEKRVKDTKRKAIEENIVKAEKSGNVLTQTITEDGDLIGVKETVDFESREVANEDDRKKHEENLLKKTAASAASIKEELDGQDED
jgi:CRISPR/Cas system-associated protein Cas7 (RAMP superfamily)